MTNTKAPERISVDFNGNKTASVISDVPEILGTLEYQRADLAPQWQDIATAPKDGTPVLVKIKDDLSPWGIVKGGFGNTHSFQGLYAVMRCLDDIMGWGFAAPVGRGGFSDEWLDGWQPITPPEPK
jgi:hypothetical protein